MTQKPRTQEPKNKELLSVFLDHLQNCFATAVLACTFRIEGEEASDLCEEVRELAEPISFHILRNVDDLLTAATVRIGERKITHLTTRSLTEREFFVRQRVLVEVETVCRNVFREVSSGTEVVAILDAVSVLVFVTSTFAIAVLFMRSPCGFCDGNRLCILRITRREVTDRDLTFLGRR